MPQSKKHNTGNSLLDVQGAQMFSNPLLTIFADMNATFMERVATAQKEWADFVQRRIREDVAVTRQLMSCRSIVDMNKVYGEYLQTAFEQYREQSEKIVHRSESVAEHLAETAKDEAKAAARH